jgi:hypothetical protein
VYLKCVKNLGQKQEKVERKSKVVICIPELCFELIANFSKKKGSYKMNMKYILALAKNIGAFIGSKLLNLKKITNILFLKKNEKNEKNNLYLGVKRF